MKIKRIKLFLVLLVLFSASAFLFCNCHFKNNNDSMHLELVNKTAEKNDSIINLGDDYPPVIGDGLGGNRPLGTDKDNI